MENLNRYTEMMNGANSDFGRSTETGKVPRSSKFTLFADELIKRVTDEKTLERLQFQYKIDPIYDAIFKKFLTKTYVEASYLLD